MYILRWRLYWRIKKIDGIGHFLYITWLRAQMAELVDALASGASSRKGVEVRVLFWAPEFTLI